MKLDDVSLLPTAHPELQTPDGAGISIHAMPYQRDDGLCSIRLSGICQCTEEESLTMVGSILHSVTVVMVYGPEHLPVSFQAIGDAVVFDDDIERRGNLLRGYFEIDLFNQSGLRPEPGTYFISAAFGVYLSDVIRMDLSARTQADSGNRD